MATTSLCRSKRSSYTPLSSEDPYTSSWDAFTVGLPPASVDVSEGVAANIQHSRIQMAELVLIPCYGDGKEDQQMIESLTQEITDLLKRSERILLKLSASGHSEDSNVWKNVQIASALGCMAGYVYLSSVEHFGANEQASFNSNGIC